MKVIFERLISLSGVDTKEFWVWPKIKPPIAIQEVIEALKQGTSSEEVPYGDTWKHPVQVERDRDYHIRRIIYFIKHPNEIVGIEVDNECSYSQYASFILPRCVIIDGWHRLAAAIALDVDTIDIEYGGREDIKKYLTGESDVMPTEYIALGGCP